MTSPDPSPISTPTGLPEPPTGVGATDLATSSNDPDELRELLERARERLAFYESFDRIIGENIRRSGELMVETVALREQAQALAAQSAKDHLAFQETREADRARYREVVRSALDEITAVQPVIGGLVQRLQDALSQLDAAPSDMPEEHPAQDVAVPDVAAAAGKDTVPVEQTPVVPAPPAQSAPEPAPEQATTEAAPEPEPATPRTVQLLAHRVPNAKTAIALQKMLRDLEMVDTVEAREFANGELRLAVTVVGALPEDALTSWLSANGGELTSSTETVTEVTFRDTP